VRNVEDGEAVGLGTLLNMHGASWAVKTTLWAGVAKRAQNPKEGGLHTEQSVRETRQGSVDAEEATHRLSARRWLGNWLSAGLVVASGLKKPW